MEAFGSLLNWVFVWFNFTTTISCRTVPWRLMLGLVFLLIWHRTVSHLIRQVLGNLENSWTFALVAVVVVVVSLPRVPDFTELQKVMSTPRSVAAAHLYVLYGTVLTGVRCYPPSTIRISRTYSVANEVLGSVVYFINVVKDKGLTRNRGGEKTSS